MNKQGIQYITDVFKKQRPARTVQRKHLPITANLIVGPGNGRDKEHRKQQSHHHHRSSDVRTIPLHTPLNQEGYGSQYRPHNHHRMETDQTPFKEIFQRKALAPAVVVGIADNKPRENKKEIYGQIPMVDTLNKCSSGKGIALKYVIPYH